MIPGPSLSKLFPYTTLFRSDSSGGKRASASRPCGGREVVDSPGCRDVVLLGTQVNLRPARLGGLGPRDRKSTRLKSSHLVISYAVFTLKKKKIFNDTYLCIL